MAGQAACHILNPPEMKKMWIAILEIVQLHGNNRIESQLQITVELPIQLKRSLSFRPVKFESSMVKFISQSRIDSEAKVQVQELPKLQHSGVQI